MATRYDTLLEAIGLEFPGFRVLDKRDSQFQRVIDWGLRAVTLGQMTRYMTDYQTTLGRTVYVTPDWEQLSADERYITMRHELIHIRQFSRYTVVGMALLYLLVPVPMGLAWFRAKFERDAYAETIRAAAEVYGLDHVRHPAFRQAIVSQFTSSSYGWMWPFRQSLERWYDRVLTQVGA